MNFSSMNLFNCFLNLSQLLASTTSCGNEFQFNYVLHEKTLPFCVGNYFLKKKKPQNKQNQPTPTNNYPYVKLQVLVEHYSGFKRNHCFQLSSLAFCRRLLPGTLDKAAGEKGEGLHDGGGWWSYTSWEPAVNEKQMGCLHSWLLYALAKVHRY